MVEVLLTMALFFSGFSSLPFWAIWNKGAQQRNSSSDRYCISIHRTRHLASRWASVHVFEMSLTVQCMSNITTLQHPNMESRWITLELEGFYKFLLLSLHSNFHSTTSFIFSTSTQPLFLPKTTTRQSITQTIVKTLLSRWNLEL